MLQLVLNASISIFPFKLFETFFNICEPALMKLPFLCFRCSYEGCSSKFVVPKNIKA